MKTNSNPGFEFSPVGLGTWAMGSKNWRYSWGYQDDAKSEATILRAIDLGINWLDTAPLYGIGHAEELIGKIIKNHSLKKKIKIATKCGFVWKEGSRRPYPILNKESVINEAEKSLKRLKTDFIDLYQIHWPGPNCYLDTGWEAIGKLVDQGKIGAAGVCNFSINDLSEIQSAKTKVSSLQIRYNLLDHDRSENILSYCKKNNIFTIAYSPLANGLLTHAFSKKHRNNLPGDDWRTRDPNFNGNLLMHNLKVLKSLKELSNRYNKTAEQYAIAWILSHHCIDAVLVGARSPDQLSSSAQIIQLNKEEKFQLDQLACLATN